ncbi:TonB-dependent siderophore receptor [Arcobacter sp. FW59]|nr:TonB-dependent siderophore receptor [Arcobacter sp. FW59]
MQEDGVIYIIEKPKYQNFGNTTVLDEISVSGNSYRNGSAESGYLVEETKGVGIWNERKLQDTPYSMSIISKDLIENVQAKDMQDIFRMNPNTQEIADDSYGYPDKQQVTIRGFMTDNNAIINGIPTHMGGALPMMHDIERVEIISGATGFLYGGGRVGGAVNYITKKPTTKDLRNISIGSYGNESYYGHIDLGGQFNEDNTFGYRVNAFYQDSELPSNVTTEEKAISLVFDWKPKDNFYTDIKYAYKNKLNKGVQPHLYNVINRNKYNKNRSYSPDWIQTEIESHKIENSIIWDINDIFTLRTQMYYEESKDRNDLILIFNENLSAGNIMSWKGAGDESKDYGANIYLDTKFNTFSINHILTIGYSENSAKAYATNDSRVEYFTTEDLQSLNNLKNLTEPNWSDYGTLGTTPLKPLSKSQFKNILIGDDITFNEQWSALVGANYATVISQFYNFNEKYDESALTPTLSLIYKPFENLTTYVTYIESLEEGGKVDSWGADKYANEGEYLEPFISKQYEIGAKYSLNENILLNGALFRIKKANAYEVNTTPKPTYTQDGEQIHQGMEFGITGKVTDNFTVVGGMTFMDLSVEKTTDPTLEGKKPTNVATKMAKLYGEYNIPYLNGLSITGGVYYTGKRYADSSNTDILPSYITYDAGLRYKTKIDKYPTTFILNAKNLTDKAYWTNNYMLGESRAVAFSMKMEF